MKLQSKHKVDPSFNMSSMTDIVFLLLIFFILTSNLPISGLRPKLPTSEEPTVQTEKVSVSIKDNGDIIFDNKTVDLAQLEQLLADALEGSTESKDDNTIIILGDKDANFGKIVDVYNVAKKFKEATPVIAFDKPAR